MDEQESDAIGNLFAIPFQAYRRRLDPPLEEEQDILKP